MQEFERKEMYNASKARHIEARCYSNAVAIVEGGGELEKAQKYKEGYEQDIEDLLRCIRRGE